MEVRPWFSRAEDVVRIRRDTLNLSTRGPHGIQAADTALHVLTRPTEGFLDNRVGCSEVGFLAQLGDDRPIVDDPSSRGFRQKIECSCDAKASSGRGTSSSTLVHQEEGSPHFFGYPNRLGLARIEFDTQGGVVSGRRGKNDKPRRRCREKLPQRSGCSGMAGFEPHRVGTMNLSKETAKKIDLPDFDEISQGRCVADHDHRPRADRRDSASSAISSSLGSGHALWSERKSSASQRDSKPSNRRTCINERVPSRYP